MSGLLQLVGFKLVWLAAVFGAAGGEPWLGTLALVPYLAALLVRAGGRARRLTRWLAAGALGCVVDGALAALGLLAYPTAPADWPAWLVPPFIASLWIALATLPQSTLARLAPRPALAALFGAVAGPLSFAAGVRVGAVGYGESVAATHAVLALEYAVALPLLLRFLAPRVPPPPPRPARAERRSAAGGAALHPRAGAARSHGSR